jgi:nucleoside-diphosphate-sugar epimerase
VELEGGLEYQTYATFEEVSAMTTGRTILVAGVTGNQGGAVAHALQGSGFYLRGLTAMSSVASSVGRERQDAGHTARSCFVWPRDRAYEIYLQRGAQPGYPSSRSKKHDDDLRNRWQHTPESVL